MGLMAFILLWFGSSMLNVPIFQWGKRRLAKAFHGGAPSPIDGFDVGMLVLLSPFGPIGVLIGAVFTDWWCGGFEDNDSGCSKSKNRTERRYGGNATELYSRDKALALRRAGWSEREISDFLLPTPAQPHGAQ